MGYSLIWESVPGVVFVFEPTGGSSLPSLDIPADYTAEPPLEQPPGEMARGCRCLLCSGPTP